MPKKRGPKTDVLEALLKRVDGLEKKLRDEKKSNSPNEAVEVAEENANTESIPKRPQLETNVIANESAVYSPSPIRYGDFGKEIVLLG